MMKKIINIVNVIADIIVTMAIIVLGIMLLTMYIVDNDFDDIPFQNVTVYLGTDEEEGAFLKKVEEYAKEFGL